jgi:CBS domain containing-hemolysin-like protein
VPDSTELPQVLTRLLVAHSPIGAVEDAHGRDLGIITAEDVLRHYLGRADL